MTPIAPDGTAFVDHYTPKVEELADALEQALDALCFFPEDPDVLHTADERQARNAYARLVAALTRLGVYEA